MSGLRLKRLAMNVFVGIAAGLVLAVVLIRTLENRFIFFPPRYPEGFTPPENYGLHAEEVWMTAEDGVKLNAWFVPEPNSPRVLLWFHGNAENIGQGLGPLKAFTVLGVNMLAVDYRGYGKSEGSPDERGVYRDAEAVYRYLVEQRRVPPRNIIVYGHSLGGAVAIDLASRRECGGLIVESSFTTAREMARRMFLIPFFEYVPHSRFDSLAKIKRVRVPVLVVHGTRDEVIPFSMGQRLYQAAPEPKAFFPVEGAGHDSLYLVSGEPYFERLRTFIRGLPARVTAGAGLASGVQHEIH